MPLVDQQLAPASEAALPVRGSSLQEAKKRVGSNALFNGLNYVTLALVTFLIAPFLVHRLGNTTYGVWGLIGELLGYSFLLDFGIRIAVTRYVARHLALAQPREINGVLTNGLAVTLVSAFLALVAGCVFAYVFPRWFSIPPELTRVARLSVLIVTLGFAATFPGSLFNGSLTALSRYDLLCIRNTTSNILRALLLWFFLKRGCGLLAVAIISSLITWVSYGFDFIFVSRLLPAFAIRREYLERKTLRTLLNFSVYALVLSISWRLIFMTDNVVVGFVLGPVAVTFYTIGRQLAGFLRDSLGTITTLYSPLASQMDALDERNGLQRLLTAGSRIALIWALAGIVPLVVVGPRFLGFWMGKAFVGKSGPVLILLAIEVGFWAIASASGQALYGMNRHKFNAWLSLCNATANFTLSVILIRWLGAVGVAWGTVIPSFLGEGIILPVYTASLLEVSPLRFYRSAVLRPLLAATPYGLWLWLCLQGSLVRGYASLAFVVSSGLVLYTMLAWKFGLDTDEKALARRWLLGIRSALVRRIPAWGDA
jgi:O-antigen/teichoic acid export membrane protein